MGRQPQGDLPPDDTRDAATDRSRAQESAAQPGKSGAPGRDTVHGERRGGPDYRDTDARPAPPDRPGEGREQGGRERGSSYGGASPGSYAQGNYGQRTTYPGERGPDDSVDWQGGAQARWRPGAEERGGPGQGGYEHLSYGQGDHRRGQGEGAYPRGPEGFGQWQGGSHGGYGQPGLEPGSYASRSGGADTDVRHPRQPDASREPGPHRDPHYLQWRAEQIRKLDADYEAWSQERYRKFAEEFDTWRRERQSASAKGPSPAEGGSAEADRSASGDAGSGEGKSSNSK